MAMEAVNSTKQGVRNDLLYYFSIGEGISERNRNSAMHTELRQVKASNTNEVDVDEFARATRGNLVTYDLRSCFAILAHGKDPETGETFIFLSHVRSPKAALTAIQEAYSMGAKDFVLYGGGGRNEDGTIVRNEEILNVAEGRLSLFPDVKIVRDTQASETPRSTGIAIEPDGAVVVFTPKNYVKNEKRSPATRKVSIVSLLRGKQEPYTGLTDVSG